MSRAVVIHEFGGPEVLKLEERTVGDPGPGEIKVKHRAIGLNYSDVYNRTGLYPLKLPAVPGGEAAGVVTAVGQGVTDFKEGDRVGCISPPGVYSDERLMPADRAFPIPDGIGDEIAAAAMLKGMTVYYLIFETHQVKKGDAILWHAAAGGVGLIATQWASALGATVYGTAGSAEKIALARQNGCAEVINYKTEDYARRIKELTGGRGLDVVYDGVGKVTFEPSLDCLKPRGLMVSFGNASGYVTIPNLGILATKGSLYVTRPTTATYFAKTADLRKAAKALFDVIADGTVKVTINQRFKLADVADAHRALEARETSGSTVIIP